MKKTLNPKYSNPYGTWKVTTEGDVEGRTTRQLGVFTGFVDEIALHLADKCYYSLNFTAAEEAVKTFTPKAEQVEISFNIDSNTWNMKPDERVEVIREMFKNRPVTIGDGHYYSSIQISSVMTEEERLNIKREKILAKLSDQEREILGFK